MSKGRTIDSDIMDLVMERLHGFVAGRDRFYIRPATLGVSLLSSRLVEALNIDMKALSKQPYLEALRVSADKPKEVCRLIALRTTIGREALDEELVRYRTGVLQSSLSNDERATLLIMVLTGQVSLDDVRKRLGLDKEAARMRKALAAKDQGGTFTFGGNSIFGALLDKACERYGWTVEYTVWGVSLAVLQLMLEDAITSVYLTDAERKKAHISSTSSVVLRADDPKSRAAIETLAKSRSGLTFGEIKK